MMLGLGADQPIVVSSDPLAAINAAYNANPGEAQTAALTTPISDIVGYGETGVAITTPTTGNLPASNCPGSPGCPGYTATAVSSCSDGSDPITFGMNADGTPMFSICQTTLAFSVLGVLALVIAIGAIKK